MHQSDKSMNNVIEKVFGTPPSIFFVLTMQFQVKVSEFFSAGCENKYHSERFVGKSQWKWAYKKIGDKIEK